jgi:hypothetical protein
MIPNIPILTQTITEITYPTRTYKINFANYDLNPNKVKVRNLALEVGSESYDRINGYIDDLESVIQAIYLILSTERYKYIIYSWDYGVELVDLFGKPMPYVMSELPRRITEALTMDDRIEDVVDFEFKVNGNKLHTTFTAITNIGNISTELEVEV